MLCIYSFTNPELSIPADSASPSNPPAARDSSYPPPHSSFAFQCNVPLYRPSSEKPPIDRVIASEKFIIAGTTNPSVVTFTKTRPPKTRSQPPIDLASFSSSFFFFFTFPSQKLAIMFRTAVLRTSASAVRAVARPVAIRRTAALAAAPRAVAAPFRVQSLMGVRMYSAGGGLHKEEVEGRIMSLLQGFDKVGLTQLRSIVCGCLSSRSHSEDGLREWEAILQRRCGMHCV